MNESNVNQKVFIKAVAFLLIVTLLWTPMSVSAEMGAQVAQGDDVNIVIDPNGGKLPTGSAITAAAIVTYGGLYTTALKEYTPPAKTGYEFIGWHTKTASGAELKIDDNTSVTNELPHTVYAKWTANNYTVIFDAGVGTASFGSKSVAYGSPYGTLPTASRSGYGFLGWFTSAGGQITNNTIYQTVGPTTLYARWGKRYKVSFNPNTGKVGTKSKYVTKGSTYGSLPTPTKKGYKFLGWYTKKKGGSKITETKTVGLSKNITLYARWTIGKYKVTFNPNNGTVSQKSKTATYYKKYGKLPKPKRKGYIFKGWYTKKSGGKLVTAKTVYKYGSNKTLYARWSAKVITVKFNANSGKVSKKSKKIKYNKKYGSLPTPTRKNYKFFGWYSKKSGGTKITKSDVMKYTSNKTLYARWGKKSKLTFNYQGGKVKTKSKTIAYSGKYGSLPTSTRKNYIFKGWYTKKSGGTRVTSASTVTTKKNSTLYAQWQWTIPVNVMLAPKGSKARPGTKLSTFKGVTIHNTGNSAESATALNHAKYLQGSGSKNSASWHYCVDDSMITQSIPESEIAWHAGDGGSGTGNRQTIAIEICMNDGGNLLNATEYGANLAAAILHRHGHTQAVSNQNIFQHNYFSSYGKNCPQMIRAGKPYDWATFVSRVNYYLSRM